MAASNLTPASDSGAEFEENNPAQKVIVNSKPRAIKPEFDGQEASDEIAKTKQPEEKSETPAARTTALKPDVSAEELAKSAPEAETPAQPEDEQMIDEPVEKQTEKDMVDKSAQNLIDNKTYFVPVGQITKRRKTKAFLIAFLLVLVAGIAGYMLMAG